MEGIYIFVLIILIVAIMSMFLFVWQLNIGTRKNAGEIRTNLQNVQNLISVRMGTSNLLNSILSFFKGLGHRPT